MSLSKDDKKYIQETVVKGVVEGIEAVIMPVLEKHELHFQKIEKDIESLEKRLGTRIDSVEGRLDQVEGRLERIEHTMYEITDSLADKLDDHEKRIGKLEDVSAI